MIGTTPKLAGTLTIIAAITGGIYLYTKNSKFKDYNKIIKTLITAGLLFAVLIGIGGLNYDPKVAEQQRLASEKAKIEQQQKADIQNKADESKKAAEIKKAEEVKKKAADEKSKILAKFNLKEATVSRVVDGDTIELSDKSKVRFIGVNTPESTTKTEPYGKEASEYTKAQLTGKTIYLEKDVSETDKFGRLLRYVWTDIPKEINDSEIKAKMFNSKLVSEGYAEVSTYPPDVKYQEYFTKYNAEARTANKGLWAINSNGTTKGDSSKSTAVAAQSSNTKVVTTSSSVSENTSVSSSSSQSAPASNNSTEQSNSTNQSNGEVVITMQGKKYHRPGCSTIKQVKATLSKQEAENEGYTPCKRCNP